MKRPFTQWTIQRLGIIPVFFLSLFPGCYAQMYNPDASSIALAGCYSTLTDGTSEYYNEAMLGFSSASIIHLAHARPFVIKELGITNISAQFPLFPGNMQIGFQHYGIAGYQQVNSSLAYGLKLSEIIYAGIGFKYYNTMTQHEWSYLRSIGLSGGIAIRTDDLTLIAAHIIHPVTINNYPEYGATFPAQLTFGIRREIYKSSTLFSEVSYNTERELQIKLAATYQYTKNVLLRAGYHSNPVTLSFGTAILYSPLTFNIAFSYSMLYGVTPALKITYLPWR